MRYIIALLAASVLVACSDHSTAPPSVVAPVPTARATATPTPAPTCTPGESKGCD